MSGQADKKPESSYLSSAVSSINPWASSRTTAAKSEADTVEQTGHDVPANPDDHSVTHLYGQSFRTYPQDCSPPKVQWFHAVDIPKRKPHLAVSNRSAAQPTQSLGQPKKFSEFSVSDSKALETEYQKLLEAAETADTSARGDARASSRSKKADASSSTKSHSQNVASAADKVHVPVNEDFLFDVDIEARELAPVYWLGPIYEVRRGTWFYQDGSNLRPCEENLAAQLEEGYLKLKPWLHPVRDRSSSGASKAVTPKGSKDDLKTISQSSSVTFNPIPATSNTMNQVPASSQPQTYRLFGTYMNNIATYEDSSTAWLSSDSVLSWVTSSVYERFAGGGYLSGVKLVRGFTAPSKGKETDDKATCATNENDPIVNDRQEKLLKRRSAPPIPQASQNDQTRPSASGTNNNDPRELRLQRQLSSLIESDGKSRAETEEEIRRREEQEIQDDYNAPLGETPGRDIEHLVLVTHGIGQLLSLRMESVNFVHDVNILRKTIKSVYTNSADLKALNSELGDGPGNSRVQVLPVCWRHLLDFPRRRERKEHDLGDAIEDEDEYPSLEDITIEGVAFARSLISDLALDVLLYQSSYRKQITQIVSKECNHIFKLFKERNPEFNGKVHVLGHSLGSAILFDILCQQKGPVKEPRGSSHPWLPRDEHEAPIGESKLDLNFEVNNFFCLGSPIGLFQMLRGRTIASRPRSQKRMPSSSLRVDPTNDTSRAAVFTTENTPVSPVTGLPVSVASPKVEQLYNIFHPSDPISYRLEPLISASMSKLKPQLLPYTKKGIFGSVAPQGLTGIGVRVGQSVSGLWSSFSAGIASNILNRSLGLSADEVERIAAASASKDANEGTIRTSSLGDEADVKKKQLAASTNLKDDARGNTHNPTLIDDDLETLFSNFQQRNSGIIQDRMAPEAQEEDRGIRKLRLEENKVRALNRNGRVDYSIQESVLDFNPINTIASHMSYWGDEDVSHFIVSQLLS